MLNTTSYSPEVNDFPDRALWIPNHVGSSTTDDFGHKASLMAQHLNMEVIAWNRAGLLDNAHMTDVTQFDSKTYLETIAQTAHDLEVLMANRDIATAVVTGNSAAAPDAIQLALASDIVDTVAIGDPAGIQNINGARGTWAWLRHQLVEARQPGGKHNPEPGPDVPGLEQARRFMKDKRLYQQVWCSTVALDGLIALAGNPEKAMVVEFVEKTFVAPPGKMEQIATDLTRVRADTSNEAHARPLEATVLYGQYHSKYDSARAHANLVQHALDL